MTLSTAARDHRPALMRGPTDRESHDAPAFTGADVFRFAARLRPWISASSASCRTTPEVITNTPKALAAQTIL